MTFAASTILASACRSLAGSVEMSAVRSTGAKRAAIVSSFLVFRIGRLERCWSALARLVARPRDCMRSQARGLRRSSVEDYESPCRVVNGLRELDSAASPGSAPSRRIAVSHISSGGTPKISAGSTSIVSHDDSAISRIELARAPTPRSRRRRARDSRAATAAARSVSGATPTAARPDTPRAARRPGPVLRPSRSTCCVHRPGRRRRAAVPDPLSLCGSVFTTRARTRPSAG